MPTRGTCLTLPCNVNPGWAGRAWLITCGGSPQTIVIGYWNATTRINKPWVDGPYGLPLDGALGVQFSRQLALIIRRSSTRREVWVLGLVWRISTWGVQIARRSSALQLSQGSLGGVMWFGPWICACENTKEMMNQTSLTNWLLMFACIRMRYLHNHVITQCPRRYGIDRRSLRVWFQRSLETNGSNGFQGQQLQDNTRPRLVSDQNEHLIILDNIG